MPNVSLVKTYIMKVGLLNAVMVEGILNGILPGDGLKSLGSKTIVWSVKSFILQTSNKHNSLTGSHLDLFEFSNLNFFET